MSLIRLPSPSLGLPQSRLFVRRDYNVRALINVGSGFLDLVSGRPCTLTGAVQRTVGPSGRRFHAAATSIYAESPTGIANGTPLTLLVVSTSTSSSSVAAISDARSSWSCPKIESTSGVITAYCKVSGGTQLSITGPTVTVGKTYVVAAHWRPGVGLKASFDGGAVQSSSHSATTLYVAPSTLWMGGNSGSSVYLLAAITGELTDDQLRALSKNPWCLLDEEDHLLWWPSASGGGGVSASGDIQAMSLSAPTGAATGAAAASGSIQALSLSPAEGSATGRADAAGSLQALSLTTPEGSATGASAASAGIQALSISAPSGDATGSCSTSGEVSAVSLSAPTGTAFSGAGTVADGALAAIGLTAPSGSATGGASASGDIRVLSLSASAGNASGAASCSGAFHAVSITACNGTATGTAPASRASAAPVFCRIVRPVATVRLASDSHVVRVPDGH